MSGTYPGWVPTPVGPAERDPDDPDFWDWDPPETSAPRRRNGRAVVAALLVIAVVVLLIASSL